MSVGAIVYFIFYNIKSTKENVLSLQTNMGGIGRRGFLPVALGMSSPSQSIP